MTEKSRFFAGAQGDERQYDQAELAATFASHIRNGFCFAASGGNLTVTATVPATRAVSVATGSAWVNGYLYENDAALTLAIETADASPRIDAVVLRLDPLVNREVRLAVRKGTPATTPVAPAPVRDGSIYELVLAHVTVPANAQTISGANISTAPKVDPTLCGYSGPAYVGTSQVTANASLDMANQRVINVGAPSNANDAATKSYVDAHGGTGGGTSSVPAGCLMYWAGSTGTIPSGWLLCEGQYVAIASYPTLYAAVGTLYGPLSGQNFKLPDGRSNVVGCYDSRYPEWTPIGTLHGQMAHTATTTGTQNLVQWLVVGGLIIKY